MNAKALGAEFTGTFLLVAGVLGAALFSFPNAGIVGVALSIGLTVMATAYAIGHVSGGHYHPAVTIGRVVGGRFPAAQAPGYIAAQCLGAIAAAFTFYTIASGKAGFAAGNFASNTFGGDGYGLTAAFLIEAVLTALLLLVVMGVTRKDGPSSFAPLAIGATLAAVHLMSIPVTNTSVNPARSLGPALMAGGEPMADLWLFIVAPILGGIAGALLGKWLLED
ncbi:MAG: aquaporin [Hyphomicrobium sp.]